MKFKCCEWALSHLVINSDDLTYCCASFDKQLKFIDNYHGELIDVNNYIENRKKYIELCKNGEYPEVCKDCPTLQEREWNEEVGFTDVNISNRTKCSCDCTYCIISNGGDPQIKKYLNTREVYDVIPLLKHLKDNNMFKKGCHFIIGGGECSEYPDGELKWLVDFIFSIGGSVEFLSSGITYSQEIFDALKNGKSKLKVSVDAGTKKVYEQIKRVKGYDEVWNNLKKYVKAERSNLTALVTIKYVIIPGVNDKEKEVKEFLKRCDRIGCHSIEVNVEFYWMSENYDKPISNDLKKTLMLFKKHKNVVFSSNISTHVANWLGKNL